MATWPHAALGMCAIAAACGGRTPTDIDTASGASSGVGPNSGAGASSGMGTGAGSGMGTSSGADGGAGSSSGNGGAADGGDDATDAGVYYARTDAGPALFELSVPQGEKPGPTIAFQCLTITLPVGSNGLPNCFVVVERPLGSETLAECQQCDDVPGLAPFVPSVPLSELGQGLTNGSCLCSVTPSANPAACLINPEPTIATWCYVNPAQVPDNPVATGCASKGGGVLAFSSTVGPTGHLFVACFPVPSP